MSRYSLTERLLAQALNKLPFVKSALKACYQTLNYWVYKRPHRFKALSALNSIPESNEFFFGYYDKCPISTDGRYILFHRSSLNTQHQPQHNKPVSICVWDIVQQTLVYKAETNAYNWQQGARLQWLSSSKFIYNNYSEKLGYHAVIVKTEEMQEFKVKKITCPVYDCYKEEFALTLNFERLHKLRPDYGYRSHPATKQLAGYDQDGVFFVNLATGHKELLLSISALINLEHHPRMDKGVHKVNHIMIAPNGKRFMFLHRYFVAGRRYDRLILADIDGGNLTVLADDEMVSHCCWLNNDEIIGYLRDDRLGDKYYRIDVNSQKKALIGRGVIDEFGDGHPSVHGNLMIFDTYPNKSRMKELFLFDLKTAKLTKLGEFLEPLKYNGQTRCDLHPRFSGDGQKVFFDSVHDGKRKLYWIDL